MNRATELLKKLSLCEGWWDWPMNDKAQMQVIDSLKALYKNPTSKAAWSKLDSAIGGDSILDTVDIKKRGEATKDDIDKTVKVIIYSTENGEIYFRNNLQALLGK